MNNEDHKDILEDLNRAAYSLIRVRGLHNLVKTNGDWDKEADKLAGFLFGLAETWVDLRIAEVLEAKAAA